MSHKDCIGHWKDEVQVDQYTVKLSGLFHGPEWLSSRNKMTGSGIYLDKSWKRVLRAKAGAYIVDWPDRKAIPVEQIHQIILKVHGILVKKNTVEIACLGGHGRTGTLLACLLVYMEGLHPRQAIQEVWKRHCHNAIETLDQRLAVYAYNQYLEAGRN